MTAGGTRKLPKLDIMRALCASSVVLYHAGVPFVPGSFGVLVFFVLSGFLITYLMLLERERTGTLSLKDFYLRRCLRIFPAFYVYWLIAVGDMAVKHRVVWTQAFCSLFFVNNYYQGLHGYPYSLLSHTWSLAVEEQFYLLWPGFFLLFCKQLRKLMLILMVMIPCIWFYRAGLQFAGVSDPYIYTALETRIDAVFAGCLLALVLHTGVAEETVRRLRSVGWLYAILGLLAGSLICDANLNGFRNVVGFAVEPVLVAILIGQAIAMPGAEWMDSRVPSYLGRISYSTYLYQQIAIPAFAGRLPRGLVAIGCLAGTWAMAAFSYQFVEKPFLKLKGRYTKTREERVSRKELRHHVRQTG